jgi:hypothetical protein
VKLLRPQAHHDDTALALLADLLYARCPCLLRHEVMWIKSLRECTCGLHDPWVKPCRDLMLIGCCTALPASTWHPSMVDHIMIYLGWLPC